MIAEEEKKLEREIERNRQVDTVFVAGTALSPAVEDQKSLFRGRRDIARLLDHDLSPDRRGLIVVLGQRRMGKTSLRQFLPTLMGTDVIVQIDFQQLSLDPHRGDLHRILVEALAAALPDPPPLPRTWNGAESLRWLQDLDRSAKIRAVIAVDEVERVQDGIQAGWCTTDFLDFLRAAGDSLRHIRILLFTAYPLHRLGPHWVDRLVSATTRPLTYLTEEEARGLVLQPVPDFPDIYPPGGVDRIIEQTHGHPFLVQKVCDELVRHMNETGGLLDAQGQQRRSTAEDLEDAFDRVIGNVEVFEDVWNHRTADEQACLLRLAREGPGPLDASARDLLREGFVIKHEKQSKDVAIAVPLFAAWIREMKG